VTSIPAPPTPMKITQIAVVVRDIEAALKSYTETLGWGPWSVFDYKPPLLHDTQVKGEPVEFRMIGAETSVDGLGFELIQPVSGPSIYQEFLDTHGEGVQHADEAALAGSGGGDPDERPDRRVDRVLLPEHRADAEVRARVGKRARHRPQAHVRLPVTW
jgi:catechol 2,3-dioxygenase-like lactoylglutathione lyase family enzyme